MAFPIITEFMSHLVYIVVVVWRKKLRSLIYIVMTGNRIYNGDIYDNDCVRINKLLLTYLNHDYVF